MMRQWNVQDQRRGFFPGGFAGANIAELPVRPQVDRGAVPSHQPPARPRPAAQQQDVKRQRKRIRKRRQAKTIAPKQAPQVVKPPEVAAPAEPPQVPTQTDSPIVRPGYIVRRALQPRMKKMGGRGMPSRGAANA